MVFQSACSRLISSAVRFHSVESASFSTAAMSASCRARLAARSASPASKCALRAIEEAVASAAEALPQLVRLFLGHRAERLPLFLQRLDELGGLLPVAGVGERLDAGGQLLLLGQVGAALLVEGGEVGARALVHLIGGGLEALPQLLLLLLRRRAGRLPVDVQLPQLRRRLLEIGLFEQRLGLGAERLELGHVGPALPLFGLVQLLNARAQLVARRLPARL